MSTSNQTSYLTTMPARERGIYCNRTLNMRSIQAIGFDMDYTLIHYHAEQWERRAFEHGRQKLLALGWPVQELQFDPSAVVRGLAYDLELGNAVKANRFGYVKKARHGTSVLSYDEQRRVYSRTIIDLADDRFVFANTLFSLCKGSMYSQLVDLFDAGKLRAVHGYRDLYGCVKRSIDEAHMEGQLKGEILADPDCYVDLDPEMPLALLDQKQAGKKLLLITNAEWTYCRPMMSYAIDRFLPQKMTWRELFDVVIVGARKPGFFSDRNSLFEVVDEEKGLLQPAVRLASGGAYLGGNANDVEAYLGLCGDEILYVGDHMYGDVAVSKKVLRWRTALVLRELEQEIVEQREFGEKQAELSALMVRKEQVEHQYNMTKLQLQRRERGHGETTDQTTDELRKRRKALKGHLIELDARIAPLAIASGELSNDSWGLLMRAGNDKSQMARQVERWSDIYMARVSNFLYRSPFVYLRGPRGSLPHD